MQRIAAGNIYGDDYGHKTLWDEHCYEVQNGPHDPICQSDKTGDADGFDCPLHGKFKVSSSVFVDGNSGKNATREQWEAALKKASAKTKPGEWPIIQTYNF